MIRYFRNQLLPPSTFSASGREQLVPGTLYLLNPIVTKKNSFLFPSLETLHAKQLKNAKYDHL